MDVEPSQVNVDLKVDNTEYDYWCPSIDNFDFPKTFNRIRSAVDMDVLAPL